MNDNGNIIKFPKEQQWRKAFTVYQKPNGELYLNSEVDLKKVIDLMIGLVEEIDDMLNPAPR